MRNKLRVGDWVEVRSKDEILRTLDGKGRLDGMIFMPEMFKFCGKRFQVYKRAHKTCDYTTSAPYRTRRVDRTVHLETRCDGEAHGGCQADCLLYWKEAWLKPVSRNSDGALTHLEMPSGGDVNAVPGAGCSESKVWANTQVSDPNGGDPRTSARPRKCHTQRHIWHGGTCASISRTTGPETWESGALLAAWCIQCTITSARPVSESGPRCAGSTTSSIRSGTAPCFRESQGTYPRESRHRWQR